MTKEAVERLRTVPLFRGCDEKQLQFISTRVEDMDFPAGRKLCEEGRSGGDFFIVLSGEAEAQRGGKTLRRLGPGDFFGEISLLDNGPRTATVTASTPMRCLVLGPRQFQDVLHQEVGIAIALLRAVTQRLRATGPLPSD
jgi:CRP/FNR family cyclic AMP-dependent transcriptional regulator